MVTLDKALDIVMELSTEDRERLLDIMHRRQIEVRREEIGAALAEARRAFSAGELEVQTADEVIEALRASFDETL